MFGRMLFYSIDMLLLGKVGSNAVLLVLELTRIRGPNIRQPQISTDFNLVGAAQIHLYRCAQKAILCAPSDKST